MPKGLGGKAVCPECGSDFRKTKQRLCPDCRVKVTVACAECGELFKQNFQNQKYCSRKCAAYRFHTDPKHQSKAGFQGGKVRGAQLQAQRRKTTYPKGKGGRHLHRLVAEEILQRPLTRKEVVHHEDKDVWNYHPSNLIVFPSQADHARHHKLEHCGSPCDCPGIRLGEVMPSETS